ncbi:MAG: phage terminase family protein [Clostridiales Family XIII bacterium]|jgi:phage terminase large subunit-like protein|nr:phage terminase family protein [Clostridiales Family XIII bacterium]
MARAKHGRQEPTRQVVIPYTKTQGAKAITLYNSKRRKALAWQKGIVKDILATGKRGLWTHSKFGLSVPRRNGKNEIIIMREVYGLVELGEKILHTAHRTTTEHAAWERLYEWFRESGNGGLIASTYRSYGLEHIILTNGGEIKFRTRTTKGGLGEGYDLLVVDEAQEYQDDQEQALKYVVSDSKNPQTIFTGTPPTPASSGTVFLKYRNLVLSGMSADNGWAEWGVDAETDPQDKNAWYETNPSIAVIISERAISDEIGNDDLDFNIQRLGYWVRYNIKSAITRKEWDALAVPSPNPNGKLSVGIKYDHGGETVSMAIAVKHGEDKIFTEAIDCRQTREGSDWIIGFLLAAAPAIGKIIIDGASGQSVLAAQLKREKIKGIILPTVKQVITANSAFESALHGGRICHAGQPSLVQAASNCEKRAIGTSGGFGYRSINHDIEVSLLDAVLLAHYGAEYYAVKEKSQAVSY